MLFRFTIAFILCSCSLMVAAQQNPTPLNFKKTSSGIEYVFAVDKPNGLKPKEGDQIKLIRFGQQGVKGAGSNPKTEKEKARRRSFKARHEENIKKGKMSAAWWSSKIKW